LQRISSSVGSARDSVFAYTESLSVCSPTEEAAQQRDIDDIEFSEPQPPADPRPSGDAHATDLIEPVRAPRVLFSGESHEDYVRYQKELEVIFVSFFPEWTDTSYGRNVMPLPEIPSTTIYRWKQKWNKNHKWRLWNTLMIRLIHGLHKRKFTDDQEAHIKETIISKYIMPGILFTEQAFRVVARQAWIDFGHDPDQFKCSN
jgi:hypothetical protein